MKDTCGPQKTMPWLSKLIPNLIFVDACNVHDTLYKRGGDKEKRKNADKIFLHTMIDQCNKRSGLSSLGYKMAAYIYYISVRIFGWVFFKNNE